MDTNSPQNTHRKQITASLIRGYLAVIVPVLLALFSVRLVMTSTFLELEYNRSGFPIDQYGFSQEERLHYAKYAVDYLINDAGINYLGELTFPDGFPLFTERELGHMEDVKHVTTRAFQMLGMGSGLSALLGLGLWRSKDNRRVFRQGLFLGSAITLGIIASVIIAAMVAWDSFFTAFHQVFFEGGTWRFAYSDTLIRLFPQQFWFDAALIVGLLTATWAFIILAFAWPRDGHQRSGQQ